MTSARQLRDGVRLPAVVKTSVGTGSRGIWFIRRADDLEHALHDLASGDGFADEVLVQDFVAGTTEKAQSVFCRGRMLGFHAYRQVMAGIGPYAGSSEELTPVQPDWISTVPLAMTAALLLASPKSAIKLARGGFSAHLLDLKSIRMIEADGFGEAGK